MKSKTGMICRRLQPDDRRCFAFFHPAMPDEPLIFVEVALTEGTPDSIQKILLESRDVTGAADKADTAAFIRFQIVSRPCWHYLWEFAH